MAGPDSKKIAQLCEMGCTRAAAKSALKACKWDVTEAAMAVFDDKHQNAPDLPTDDEGDDSSHARAPAASAKGKGKQVVKAPTPDDDDEDGMDASDDDNEDYDLEDEYPIDQDEPNHHDDAFDGSDNGSVNYGDGDAYAFLNTSMDRKETITEVEEPTKKVFIGLRERGDYLAVPPEEGYVEAEIFGMGRWLSGCPEGNEQQQLFPLYNTLSGDALHPALCPYQCGTAIKHRESDFFAVPGDFNSYLQRLEAIVQTQCSGCQGWICLACEETCSGPSSQSMSNQASFNSKSKGKGKSPALAADSENAAPSALLHCSALQAVIVGVGLFTAERLWEDNKSGSSKTASPATNNKKRKVTPADQIDDDGDDDSDTAMTPALAAHLGGGNAAARSGQHKAGVGYGGATGAESSAGMAAALKQQQEKDAALANLLALVRVYLPNRDRPGPFLNTDHMPAGQTLAHLRRRFNPIASSLLSAESLSDMSDRKKLYTEFMAWLQIMSAHDNLAPLMGQPIMKPSSVTYKAVAGDKREKIVVFEASPGPRELLERILSQVRVAQRVSEAAKAREADQQGAGVPTRDGSTQTTSAAGAAEGKRLMEFCDIIVRAVAKIDFALKQSKRGEAVLRSLAVVTPVTATAGGSSNITLEDITEIDDEELKKRYIDWVKEVKYAHYNWEMAESADSSEGPSYKHYYNKEARAISSFPSRNTALMKEHMALSASLPSSWDSSIFLKTDENRPDIIKGMIVGPDNTPYQNGLYLFDILLGGNYNQGPPTVKSMTTKGGKYRLNPNLYAEGKVCLSLLGTWSGPGWVAGKSTLLQVLISIQAMILCEEPIANEPSFERDLGTPRSTAYNRNVRRMVVHIAMLEYLKNPPEGFEHIVSTHFRLKGRAISAQLDKWLEEDDKQQLHSDSMSAIHGRHGAAPTTGGSGQAFAKDVSDVKDYLARLQKGEDIFAK